MGRICAELSLSFRDNQRDRLLREGRKRALCSWQCLLYSPRGQLSSGLAGSCWPRTPDLGLGNADQIEVPGQHDN